MSVSSSPSVTDLADKLKQLDSYLSEHDLKINGRFVQGHPIANRKATEIANLAKRLNLSLAGGGDFITHLISSMGYPPYLIDGATVGLHLNNGYVTL